MLTSLLSANDINLTERRLSVLTQRRGACSPTVWSLRRGRRRQWLALGVTLGGQGDEALVDRPDASDCLTDKPDEMTTDEVAKGGHLRSHGGWPRAA